MDDDAQDIERLLALADEMYAGDPQLPGIAFAVGRVCQAWARLEAATTRLLAVLSRLPRNQTSLAILRCFAVTEQFAAIKVAAVGTLRGRSLASEIVEAIDYIDNTLRPRRNRLVHDTWEEGPPYSWSALRVNLTPKVKRPQSHRPRKLHLSAREAETIDGIIDTEHEIDSYAEYLDALMLAVVKPRSWPPAKRRAARPPRPFLRHPPGRPDP